MTERSAVRASASMATSKLAMREQGLLGVDDLGEDRGVHRDDHVVLGDDLLAVAGARVFAHVDGDELVDERRDDHEARLVDRPELAEPGRHPDEPLLDEVDRVAQEVERERRRTGSR